MPIPTAQTQSQAPPTRRRHIAFTGKLDDESDKALTEIANYLRTSRAHAMRTAVVWAADYLRANAAKGGWLPIRGIS